MRHVSISLPAALVAISLAVLMIGPSAAQTVPSESQQKLACMGDAFRLCPQHIPNRDAIIQCLATQRGALSASCRPVFDMSYKALVARRQHAR